MISRIALSHEWPSQMAESHNISAFLYGDSLGVPDKEARQTVAPAVNRCNSLLWSYET